jgi:uncharacterized protein YndB with AHSA1/START domain
MISATFVRQIEARPSIVFDALSTAEGISAWWGGAGKAMVKELDLRVGGAYRVQFYSTDGGEHEVFGEYLVVAPHTRLVWTWNYVPDGGGEPDEYGNTSQVEAVLRPISDGVTELTFTHAKLQTEKSKASHTYGWPEAFVRLEQFLAAPATESKRAGSP